MAKIVKNKESETKEKSDKVHKVEKDLEEVHIQPEPKQKDYTKVPKGVGGQFVDIGGGVKVPASEVKSN